MLILSLLQIAVYPPEIELSSALDRQSIVVQLVEDGITRDVAAEIEAPAFVKIVGSTVFPVADGEGELKVHGVSVPVRVKLSTQPISFRLDVVPTFSRAGCNTGTCHGASRGKDGFRLSLFGFDPDGDHFRLAREQPGRRMNLAVPEESLFLRKATGTVPHTGGERFKPDSELYETLLRWLKDGAPSDAPDGPRVVGIELFPPELVLRIGDTHRLIARAKYSDGSDRDITSLATFITSNEPVAALSTGGVVSAARRGEAFLMARYDAFTVGVPAIVVPPGEFEWPDEPEEHYIDRHVHDKLRKLRERRANICSDEVFLRRVHLDIVGLLPSPDETAAFLGDPNREALVDGLLSRKEFVELWVMKFAELLQIRSSPNVDLGISYKAAVLYYNWLAERIAANVPMNEIARELIGSSGGTFSSPATNYYQVERDTLKLAENTAQVFLGMRVQCAQCHNHPFDRWTMDDYYGFVAFFAQIGRKRGEDPRETIVFRGGGDTRHPVDNRVMAPKFLGGETPDVRRRDRREVLADWMASPENPYFARNLANIVWAHFFGRGIVEPVDDVRVSNPPSNEPLLAALAKRFVEANYDFKTLVRDICTSRAYQRTGAVRRLRAEVLFDAISQVTDTDDRNKFRGLPRGARAVQIADGSTSSYFLETFGRATRETVCSCEVKMEPNLSQALHLINGDTVHEKIKQGKVVERLLAGGSSPGDVVDALYLRCLMRRPTDAEKERLLAFEGEPHEVLEDVFWALLNSKEFMFNH